LRICGKTYHFFRLTVDQAEMKRRSILRLGSIHDWYLPGSWCAFF